MCIRDRDAARAAGYSPYIMASYRPYSSQEYIYNGKASQLSWPDYPDAQDYADAAKLVAAPGTSDHPVSYTHLLGLGRLDLLVRDMARSFLRRKPI